MLVEQLAAAIPSLPPSDLSFANSLLSGGRRFGFTSRQEPHVIRLIEKARNPISAERKTVDLGDFATMIRLFSNTRLKYPTVHLFVADAEGEVELTVAGDRSSHKGTINIATPGGFGNNTWFGRILTDGKLQVSPRAQPSTALIAILQAFAADPLKVAAEQGKLTGRCCFCTKPLDNPKSTALGYGPVCGKRWTKGA